MESKSVIEDAFETMMNTMFGATQPSLDPEIQKLMEKAFPPPPPMATDHSKNDDPTNHPT